MRLSDINTIIICLTHTSMGKPCSCIQFIKSHIFYCKSRENSYQYYKLRENPYQVLQVTRTASECKGSYDKSFSPKYQAIPEKISRVCCQCHCFTRNNANGNKLVIFPNIALYYGDTYIIVQVCVIFNCAMEVLHSTVNLTKK